MRTAGIDIGSITTKAAVLEDGKVLGTKVGFTGYNAGNAGKKIYEELLQEIGIASDSIEKIIATGYGRNSVQFANKAMTEIICHGAGATISIPRSGPSSTWGVRTARPSSWMQRARSRISS